MALTAKKVYAILKRQISDMEAKLNSPVRYRGTVATADLLPLNPDIGDMYNIESKSIYGEAGMNVAWNGVVWDTMGAPIDMSLYFTKEEAEAVIQRLVTEYFEKNPVKPGATTEQAQQIEQNKKDVASLKEDISTKITKFYASNQGETHLADSDDGKIMDMVLYGRSEQKQYSGKNLFTFSNNSRDINGVIFESKDGIITAKGTSTKEYTRTYFQFNYPKDIFTIGETYTFSLNSNDANLCLFALYKENDMVDYKRLFEKTTKCATVKIPDNVDLIIRCVVDINVTVNATATIQIEKGSTATSYEPYVGGQPSPSPDYPQDIKSVVNPTVKVCGKNLLNHTLGTTTKNGITCTANGDGTYTLNGTATTITTFDIAQDVSCSSFRLVGCPVGGAHDASYELQARTNNLIYGYDTGDGKNIKADKNFFIRIRINTGINCNNLLFKPMIVDASLYPDATYDDFEPYKEQTVTLPYTLNAIPVSSGGNVTIDGQQYVADYVDVEREKLVRMVDSSKLDNTQSIVNKTEWLLAESQEIDLTTEEITAFKALTTYYPTTNISVNSEQLDGYTAFNYPISMANGWNYVKKQLNDNRDYIYDMDIQSAEAYVNSEYAVALTELEV